MKILGQTIYLLSNMKSVAHNQTCSFLYCKSTFIYDTFMQKYRKLSSQTFTTMKVCDILLLCHFASLLWEEIQSKRQTHGFGHVTQWQHAELAWQQCTWCMVFLVLLLILAQSANTSVQKKNSSTERVTDQTYRQVRRLQKASCVEHHTSEIK